MHRRPRRIHPHARSLHGTRLSAADLRRQRALRGRVPIRSGRQVVARRPVPARQRWSRRRIAFIAVPVFVTAVVAILLVPVLLKLRSAYGQVFVTPMPRVIVTENAEGSPVIVTQVAGMPRNAVPTPTIPGWTGTDRVTILLLGADTNADRTQSGEPPLSDTIIIVTIDPTTKQVGMLSIPRDLLVPIPGAGEQKINAAFSIGSQSSITGPGLVRATIEYNFHIPIDYFVQVDFDGFEKIVDTLGGVMLDVPAPLKDDLYPGKGFNYTRLYFRTGLQRMDGARALSYVRTRHDDSDFGRSQRQQQLLEALRRQATAMNLIASAPRLIDELSDAVRTDLPPGDAIRLGKLATEIKSDDIHSYSILPGTTEQWLPGQPYYLIPHWSTILPIVEQMLAGIPQGTPAPSPVATPVATP